MKKLIVTRLAPQIEGHHHRVFVCFVATSVLQGDEPPRAGAGRTVSRRGIER